MTQKEIESTLGDKVSMCNVRQNLPNLHLRSVSLDLMYHSIGAIDYARRPPTEQFRYMAELDTHGISSKYFFSWPLKHLLGLIGLIYLRFEHIYRHHSKLPDSLGVCFLPMKHVLQITVLTTIGRYRITEGSEEIQMRKIAAYLFGYMGPKKAEMSKL